MAQVSYGTITITDTNDIEKIYMEYAQSQNNQTAPTTGWDDDIPTWREGYYIWQRTVTKMSGVPLSQDSYGEPVCLTGSTGSSGAPGQSVDSIVTSYCNYGTGTPAATYSGWQSAVPAYDSTKPNYWIKTVITYSNPTTTDTKIYKDNGITSATSTAAAANTTAQNAKDKADDAWDKADNAETIAGNANTAISDLNQYFWRKKSASTNVPAGSYVTNIPGTTYQQDPANGGFNSLVQANGIFLRNGIATLSSWTGNALTFYHPTNSGQGNRGMELSSSTLKFYDSTGTVAQATFGGTQATVSGTINVYDGKIGNASNYWYIGNYTDYNQNDSAIIKSIGTASIQLNETNTWRIATNRIHTAWAPATGTDAYKLHFPIYVDSENTNRHWDYGLHLPTSYSDKFLYIRNAASSETLDNLLDDLDDAGYDYWNYIFYIDGSGNLHAGDIYSHGTLISGTSAPYLLKSGGTMTGNITMLNGAKLIGGVTGDVTGNVSGSAGKLSNTSKIGDTNKPVYFSANGVPVAISYEINKSVPSNAIFTDQNVRSTQANTTKLWLVGTPTSGDRTGELNYDSNIYADTTAGALHATTFEGNLSGTASRATADSDGNTIKTTYLKLTGGNVTGAVTFGSSVSVDELTTGVLVVNGAASFTNNLQANTINGVAVGSSPKFTDVNVTQTATTTSAAYEVLFSYTADNTTRTEGARKTSTFTYNPNTKELTIGTVKIKEASTGFTISGGTTSKTLTVGGDYTLAAAAAKGVVTSIDTSANLPTSNAVKTFVEGKGYITANHTSTYSLPLAASGTRGGVQIGYTQSGKNYPVQLSSEKMYVNVPWENTWTAMTGATSSADGTVGYIGTTPPKSGYNTKYWRADGTWSIPPNDNTHRPIQLDSTEILGNNTTVLNLVTGSGITLSNSSGTVTIAHKDTSSQSSSSNSGRTYIQSITLDTYGHVTGLSTATETVTNSHYTTHLYVGLSDSTGNAATNANQDTYLKLFDNTTVRESHKLLGGNGLTVTSDANGHITFNSPSAFTAVEAVNTGTEESPKYVLRFTKSGGGTTDVSTENIAVVQSEGANKLVSTSSPNGINVTGPVKFVNGIPVQMTSANGDTIAWGLITGAPSTYTPSSHTHGNLSNDGKVTTTATIASGDKLVIVDTDSTAGSKITGSSITFGTSTTTFLSNKGTWETPSAAGSATNATYATYDASEVSNTTKVAIADKYIPKSIGTAAGDIIYWSASGTPTRLAKGSNGQVLKLANGVPTWGTDNNDNTWRGIQNNLTSDSTTDSLSAAQGKALANGSARDSTKLPLAGGILTGGLEIKGHIAGDTGSSGHGLWSGGGYHSAYNNIILHGNATTGSSGIAFVSDKGDTTINQPSDRAFIQFHAYGITTASAENVTPTLATSGESNRLVIGVGNDATDEVWLQTPATYGLKHQVGATTYIIPSVSSYTTTANYPVISTTTGGVHAYNTSITMNGGTITATTFSGTFSGNASSATEFNSNATVTLTGDTTGTSAGSKKSWSVTTTTSRLSGLGRRSTVEKIALNPSIDTGFKISWHISDSTARTNDATNSPSFDAGIINIPWDWGAYNGQIAIANDSTTPRIQIRAASHVDNGESASPRYTPNYGAWREVVTATKATQIGSATQPIYVSNTGQITAGTALGDAAYKAADYYVKRSGDTMTGALNTANGTANKIGDDSQLGDFNVAGTLGVQGLNGTTGIALLQKDTTWGSSGNYAHLTYDGTYVNINKLFKVSASGNTVTIGSQNASFTHIYNSLSIPFIFNNSVLTTSGSLGNNTYPFTNVNISGAYNMIVSGAQKAAMHYDSTLEAIVFSFA